MKLRVGSLKTNKQTTNDKWTGRLTEIEALNKLMKVYML